MLIMPESLKGVLAVLMCLALIVWSAVPSFTHSPAVFETIQGHLEMVEDHGHSHGFEEDLYWAMHGHSHDTADHDHNPAYLLTGRNPDPAPHRSTSARLIGPAPAARITDHFKDKRSLSMNTLSRGSRGVFLPLAILALFTLVLIPGTALAHDVTPGDAGYIQEIWGVHIIPFIYLGAKHMITGYDHILHSVTMLLGVWFGWGINAYIIDAIIGLSVVYKALDNLGAFQKWLGFQPNTKAATLIFGLFHGTGLASKILEYQIAEDGLLANLLSFNVGVELGQLLALFVILIVMGYWRRSPNFMRQGTLANIIMAGLGVLLTYQQIAGYIAST
jgi:hypothetical protein